MSSKQRQHQQRRRLRMRGREVLMPEGDEWMDAEEFVQLPSEREVGEERRWIISLLL
jgi:hypothetical protein